MSWARRRQRVVDMLPPAVFSRGQQEVGVDSFPLAHPTLRGVQSQTTGLCREADARASSIFRYALSKSAVSRPRTALVTARPNGANRPTVPAYSWGCQVARSKHRAGRRAPLPTAGAWRRKGCLQIGQSAAAFFRKRIEMLDDAGSITSAAVVDISTEVVRIGRM